jgi:hypothetical protein
MLIALATGASAQIAEPHRKAGWWEMAAHLPNGTTMTRYLCLDATFDARHSVLAKQDGCTQTVEAVAGGYSFKKTCGGETTSGTAIGDFNTAYKITEQRGSARIQTDARWAGACPAGASLATCRCPTAPS